MPATAAAQRQPGKSLHVIKFGGELLDEPRRRRQMARAVCAAAERRRVVVVHGGGREVDAELARFGIPKRTVDGVRITDAATLDVVLGVLAGRVNTRLVAAIGAAGVSAVGLTGVDAGLATVSAARRYRATDGTLVDLGFVGLPKRTGSRPALLLDLTQAGHVPVLASIGTDGRGRLFNVNADTLAADLAAAAGRGSADRRRHDARCAGRIRSDHPGRGRRAARPADPGRPGERRDDRQAARLPRRGRRRSCRGAHSGRPAAGRAR